MKVVIRHELYKVVDDGNGGSTEQSVGHDTFELEFDSADDVANALADRGIIDPSNDPDFNPRVWFTSEPYQYPTSGICERRSAHRGAGTTDEEWRQVWELVKS